MPDSLALAGLRVLELGGGHSVPFAGRLLADLGAEVIKVEPPDGDPTRREGPRMHGDSPLEAGALFEYLNWNKASLCLDPADGPEAVAELAATASLVLAGDDLDALGAWGLDPAAVLAIRPDLVLTTVTPFGACGPDSWRRGSDLVAQATGGLMAFSGTWDQEPLKRGLRQTSYTTGLTAAYASLAGCLYARRSGHGIHVDVARREVVTAELILNTPMYTYIGAVQGRRAAAKDPFTGEPILARDCYVTVQTNTWTGMPKFAEFLGEPRLCEQRFDTREKRGFNAAALTEILSEALRDVGGRDLFVRASKAGMLAGFAQSAEQLLSCPQLAARGAFREMTAASGPLGNWRFPAVLAELTATPTAVRHGAPALGDRGGELAASWLAVPPSAPVASVGTVSPDGPGRRPLAGLKVVDLSTVLAVPLIAAMLSDLGAAVVKVEAPDRLDQGRGPMFGPLLNNTGDKDPWNRSGTFHSLNRGKRGISLNLKTERGREILFQMVADADVLLGNFTPRVMRSWGLSYEKLAAINPALVMLSNTGYGSTGPWSEFKAQGTTLEATMGVGTYCGYAGGKPTKVGQSYPDFIACWTGLTMLFATLLWRERSGRGQHIDLGMYQLGPVVIPEALIAAQAGLPDLGRVGNREVDALLSNVFPATGRDRWVAISVHDDADWQALAGIVPGLSSAPPADEDGMNEARAVLTAWSRNQDADESASLLQAAGIAAGPVQDVSDLLLDPHLFARGMFEDVDLGPEAGVTPVLSRGYRWHSADSSVSIQFRGPQFAEHNDEVLAELGLDAQELDSLRAAGVIVDEPVAPPDLPPFDLAEGVCTHLYKRVDPDFRERLTRGRAALRLSAATGTETPGASRDQTSSSPHSRTPA